MRFVKDPDERWDFTLHFKRWLRRPGQTATTLVSADWTLTPIVGGGTAAIVLQAIAGSDAIVNVTGGALGDEYDLTCHAIDSAARSKDTTARLVLRTN